MFFGIKDNFNSLTKPGYRDFNDFPLPEKLFQLYHVLRPFMLLKRYSKKPLIFRFLKWLIEKNWDDRLYLYINYFRQLIDEHL